METSWMIDRGASPLIAVALHDGHEMTPESLPYLVVDEYDRVHEEDPYTEQLAHVADTRVVVQRSRFELDLNRPLDQAAYKAKAWDMRIWRDDLPQSFVVAARNEYHRFYREIYALLDEWVKRFGYVVIYDLHSYNHHRDEPVEKPDDPEENPDVNVGTGNMNCSLFGCVVDRFISDLSQQQFCGRPLDVRRNVKFEGGHFSRLIHERYPDNVCVLAIEFKKMFMDEWTGDVKAGALTDLRNALAATVPGVLEEINSNLIIPNS